jgi:uncharacterized protein involved in exopolysaccharide biosynthesis
MKRVLFIIASIFVAASFSVCYGQKKNRTVKAKPQTATTQSTEQQQNQAQTQQQQQQQQSSTKSSPAYGELVMRKVEVEADLKQLLVDYTEEHPRAKEKKVELDALNREMDKIAAMDNAMIPKLTSTIGKLILRKIELEAEMFRLSGQYAKDHPFIKKTRDKLEVIEGEIQKALQ